MLQNFFEKTDAADSADLVYKMVSQCCGHVKHFFSPPRRSIGAHAAAALRPAPPPMATLQLEDGRLVKGFTSQAAGLPEGSGTGPASSPG